MEIYCTKLISLLKISLYILMSKYHREDMKLISFLIKLNIYMLCYLDVNQCEIIYICLLERILSCVLHGVFIVIYIKVTTPPHLIWTTFPLCWYPSTLGDIISAETKVQYYTTYLPDLLFGVSSWSDRICSGNHNNKVLLLVLHNFLGFLRF